MGPTKGESPALGTGESWADGIEKEKGGRGLGGGEWQGPEEMGMGESEIEGGKPSWKPPCCPLRRTKLYMVLSWARKAPRVRGGVKARRNAPASCLVKKVESFPGDTPSCCLYPVSLGGLEG